MRSSVKPSDFVIRVLTISWSYDQAGCRSKLRVHISVFCLQTIWQYFCQIYTLQASKDERIWAQIGFNSETVRLARTGSVEMCTVAPVLAPVWLVCWFVWGFLLQLQLQVLLFIDKKTLLDKNYFHCSPKGKTVMILPHTI